MSKPTHARKENYRDNQPPRAPAAPLVDASKKFSVWCSKYQCTYYGATRADCIASMVADDKKRQGKRFVTGGFNGSVKT